MTRAVLWRGRQVNTASALGAAVATGDFERALELERQVDVLDAIRRARTDRVHNQLVFAAHAKARGNGYFLMRGRQ